MHNRTKGVAERLQELALARQAVVKQREAIADYINWFEATQMTDQSGAFEEYFRTARQVEHPSPVHRPDSISAYLDEPRHWNFNNRCPRPVGVQRSRAAACCGLRLLQQLGFQAGSKHRIMDLRPDSPPPRRGRFKPEADACEVAVRKIPFVWPLSARVRFARLRAPASQSAFGV